MNLARRALIVGLVSAFIAGPSSATGLAGTRNPSFGDGGAAKIGIGADELPAGEVATLPDGRIVIAGATRSGSGEQTPVIVRLLPDGRRDPSFGDNGIARLSDYVNLGDVAVLADGAVLIASLDVRPQARVGIGVLRVGPDGTLDRTFGTDGRAEFGPDGGSGAFPRLVALPDGSFFAAAGVGFVAGQDPPADGGSNLYLVKGRPDGRPDPGFGQDGTLHLGAAAAVSMALDPRGGLVLSAYRAPDGSSYRPVHIGFDGTVDFRYEDVPSLGVPLSVGVRPDGSVYGAGGRGVVRWRADGTLDQSYGSYGFAAYPHGTDADYRSPWRTLTVVADGGVVVTGGEREDPAVLARFGPDGTLDRRFGTEGVATFPEARIWYPAGQPAVAADGDLLWPVFDAGSRQAELWKLSLGSGAGGGYWLLSSTGQVHAFGGAVNLGDGMASSVDIESTPTGRGYWTLNRNGVVSTFGDATRLGDVEMATLANDEQPASLSATPSGKGYWVFTNRGRAIAFGDAAHLGDMAAVKLNRPVLGSVATPSGKGYYMVAADGGIFAFGDANFAGSMGGQKLNAPVQSLVPDGDGHGYWLVASDGGIFAFDAPFRGSMGATLLNKPVSGMVRYGDGYLMVGADGGIFNFSSLPFAGSLGDKPPSAPVVAVAALP